jgi:serine/threonine-protein kinase
MAVLTWLSGERKNERVEVGAELILGRGKHLRIVLDDRRSSREHARVFAQGERYYIQDLGSLNGTFLNDTQVGREAVVLEPGDNIRIGLSWFCFGEPTIAADRLDAFTGYTVSQQLLHHQGGMLLEATQDGLDRKVHLRVISLQISHNAQYLLHQFIQEVKTVAKLVHRNISLLLDFGARGLYLYAAFEALEGEELTGYVEAHHPLPVARVIEIAREMANGLEYAERVGINHLHLEPQVVLLSRGRPILRDFGISRLVDQVATKDPQTGLLHVSAYVAPEMTRNEPGGIPADIYSFGLILQYLLTGRAPYPERSPDALVEAIQQREPEALTATRSDIPGPLQEAIRRMTASDPAQRLQHFAEVLELLDTTEREIEIGMICERAQREDARRMPWQRVLRRQLAQPAFCWGVFVGCALLVVTLVWML